MYSVQTAKEVEMPNTVWHTVFGISTGLKIDKLARAEERSDISCDSQRGCR